MKDECCRHKPLSTVQLPPLSVMEASHVAAPNLMKGLATMQDDPQGIRRLWPLCVQSQHAQFTWTEQAFTKIQEDRLLLHQQVAEQFCNHHKLSPCDLSWHRGGLSISCLCTCTMNSTSYQSERLPPLSSNESGEQTTLLDATWADREATLHKFAAILSLFLQLP